MNDQKYITVTAQGALYAAQQIVNNQAVRNVILKLLAMDESPLLSDQLMCELTGFDESNLKLAKAIFYQLEVMHYVQGQSEVVHMPVINFENELSSILSMFSSMGSAMLLDNLGFLLGSIGFSDENLTEIMVMSTRLATLYRDNHDVLSLKTSEQGHICFGVINYQGMTQLGVYVMDLYGCQFNLAIAGIPFLNQRSFRDLIWVLVYRYSSIGRKLDKTMKGKIYA